MFCNICGHRNAGGSNFCSSCGAVLDTSGSEHTTIVFHPNEPTDDPEGEVSVDLEQIRENSGLLVIKRGPGAGSRFALEQQTTTLGRHPESDIFLDDVTVSRSHAVIELRGDSYLLRDQGSLNGTYLNRARVDEAELRNGDELQVGTFKLVFFSAPGAG